MKNRYEKLYFSDEEEEQEDEEASYYQDNRIADDVPSRENENNSVVDENMTELNRRVFQCLPKVTESFDILTSSQKHWNQHLRKLAEFQHHLSAKLFPNGEDGSKVRFCCELKDLFIKHQVPDGFERELMELMKSHLEDCQIDIPFDEIKYSDTSESLRGHKSTLQEYCHPNDGYEVFDVCRNGCCVFIGSLEEYTHCPNCNLARFKACPSCKAPEDSKCSKRGSCSKRKAYNVTHYRSFINIIKSLLQQDAEAFQLAINYVTEDTFDDVVFSNSTKSKVWKENSVEMNRKARQMQNESLNDIIEVSLCLSMIYDGVKLFKNKDVKCWPLGVSILNLPPHLRGKTGIGTFLLSIISHSLEDKICVADHCSGVEYFIFRDCFIEELLALRKGVTINIGNKTYFLQCRLLLSIMDGRGLEKFFQVQGAGSHSGCMFCNEMPGRYSKILKKEIYGEHRKFLPLSHVLRFFGQSGQCCPVGTLDGESKNADCETIQVGTAAHPKFMETKAIIKNERINWEKCCCLTDTEFNLAIITNHISKGIYVWFHSNYPLELFKDYLYFAHCDFRPFIQLLINNNKYIKTSVEAQEVNNDVRKGPTKKKRKSSQLSNNSDEIESVVGKHCHKGFKGLCPIFLLDYFSVKNHVCYDPMHVLKNIMLYIIYAMKGQTANGERVSKHSEAKGLHPDLWPREKQTDKSGDIKIVYGRGPYFVPQKNRQAVDFALRNVYIPTNESGEYELKQGIFSKTGYLKAVALIKLLINYLDYVVFIANMNQAYCDLLSMLSFDICNLLAPMGFEKHVEADTNRILETLCTIEAMFPESERYFTSHELVHLSLFRLEQGAIQNWWFVSGERFVGKVASFVLAGGRSYDKTIWKKYMAFELANRLNFSTTLYENSKDSPFLKILESPETGKKNLSYSSCRFFLCEQFANNWKFSNRYYFLGSLIVSLILEIESTVESAAEAVASPLYQLMLLYLSIHTRTQILKGGVRFAAQFFAEWLIEGNIQKDYSSKPLPMVYEMPTSLEAMINTQKYIQKLHNDGIPYFKCAFIAGKRFDSRGAEFQQRELPDCNTDMHYLPMECNKLRSVLKTSKGRDSVVRILAAEHRGGDALGDILKRDYSPRDNIAVPIAPHYGKQISFKEYAASVNGYLRIQFPGDPILHEPVLFAAINAWELTLSNRLYLIDCSDEVSSYLSSVRFVPIKQIVPTRIALACLNANNQALAISKISTADTKWIVTLEMDRTRRRIMKMLHKKVGSIYSSDVSADVSPIAVAENDNYHVDHYYEEEEEIFNQETRTYYPSGNDTVYSDDNISVLHLDDDEFVGYGLEDEFDDDDDGKNGYDHLGGHYDEAYDEECDDEAYEMWDALNRKHCW